MAEFYMPVVQSKLLYWEDLQAINNRNLGHLENFYKRLVRHMTGQHIQKHKDRSWTYPDHKELDRKCRLFSVRTYTQRMRGTLKKYMKTYIWH